ncbi:MAG: YbdK family carboxylate-amine ligase [Steroidobacteraceae bacterium]
MARQENAAPRASGDDSPGAFHPSQAFTLGAELELMVLDGTTGQLASESPALLNALKGRAFAASIKAEITQSMIEVNSGVHSSADSLEAELREICGSLRDAAAGRGLALSGGGAHPFRDWPQREIYPDQRFDRLQESYGYLVKQFTVFGLHVHVGVTSADDAIYLTHVFNCFVPHFTALTASSPFQRGVDTGFQSSRVNVISMFPLSGQLPDVREWREFEAYFARMRRTGLVRTMKDFYWDARPKPEFGTVELRACDMPLTITHAADLTALCQAIARCYLDRRPRLNTALQHEVGVVNRFLAAKSAWDATILDVGSDCPASLAESAASLIDRCMPYCADHAATGRLQRLQRRIAARSTDADWIRDVMGRNCDWARLLMAQSARLAAPGEADG